MHSLHYGSIVRVLKLLQATRKKEEVGTTIWGHSWESISEPLAPQASQAHVTSVECNLTSSQESRCRVTGDRSALRLYEKYSLTSTIGHFSTTATFFGGQSIHRLLFKPLYNGHLSTAAKLFCPQGAPCGEVQL